MDDVYASLAYDGALLLHVPVCASTALLVKHWNSVWHAKNSITNVITSIVAYPVFVRVQLQCQFLKSLTNLTSVSLPVQAKKLIEIFRQHSMDDDTGKNYELQNKLNLCHLLTTHKDTKNCNFQVKQHSSQQTSNALNLLCHWSIIRLLDFYVKYSLSSMVWSSDFQPGFSGSQGFHEHLPRVPRLVSEKIK